MRTPRRFALSLLAACLLAIGPAPAAAGATPSPSLPTWDDFRRGFAVGAPGSGARWFYFATPDGRFVGDDGRAVTGPRGLAVVPTGRNAATGLPAFAKTVAQEPVSGLPGGLDHVKWLVYMNHLASSGVPGFDALPGRELVCQSTIGGRVTGTRGHPFGAAVADPDDDPRLAAVALNAIDFDTNMVFDVFLTNERIYAVYERLPFGRASMGGPYGEYAAFTYAIPIAARTPGARHTVAVAYDRAAGTVRWLVDGAEKFRVARLGLRIGIRGLLLDHGGAETPVAPSQLACGMGMFSLLDGHGPGGVGLVRLSSAPGFYFNPALGQPAAEAFVDPDSRPSSRLFGQGAALEVREASVGYWPGR
jgi:hypothetical protein